MTTIDLITTHGWDRYDAIRDALTAMGYTIGRRIVQVKVPPVADFDANHPEWDRVLREIEDSPADTVQLNWEFDDHNAWDRPNTTGQNLVRNTLARHAHEHNKQVGLYNPIRVHTNSYTPVSSVSLYNYRLQPAFDYIPIQAYMTRQYWQGSGVDLPTYTRFFTGLASGFDLIRRQFPHVPVQPMFQLSIRPTGTTREPMDARQATMYGRALAMTNSTPIWWFEATNDSAIDDRLREAETLRDAFLSGLGSVGIRDAGGPQGVN